MTIYTDTFPRSWFLDRGLSDEARTVRLIRYREESSGTSFDAVRTRTQIWDGLANAVIEAANDNWDGYQAFRADPNALFYALEFLNLLPFSTPFPEIAIDKDGEIAIEWDYGPRRIISIRVARDGTLHFAWLNGLSSNHGVEILQDRIPNTILLGIDHITNAATD